MGITWRLANGGSHALVAGVFPLAVIAQGPGYKISVNNSSPPGLRRTIIPSITVGQELAELALGMLLAKARREMESD